MINNHLLEKLLSDVNHLQSGDQVGGLICPKCSGGRSEDRSFSLGRNDLGFVYCCHRASCGFRGFSPADPVNFAQAVEQLAKPNLRKARIYTGELVKMPEDALVTLETHVLIGRAEVEHFGIRWATDFATDFHGRCWIPVVGEDGKRWGNVARCLPGDKTKPKSLTYKTDVDYTGPGVFHSMDAPSKTLILVEDCWSAIRLARKGINGGAMLGVPVYNYTIMKQLCQSNDKVLVAVDPDAINVALQYKFDYPDLTNLDILRLDKDIKDMTHEELDEWLERSSV